jgi:hypothetical protein
MWYRGRATTLYVTPALKFGWENLLEVVWVVWTEMECVRLIDWVME